MALVAAEGRAKRAGTTVRDRTGIPVGWLAVVLLIIAACALPLVRPVDNDYWWHARTGAYILDHGIPRHDPFSWTRAGDPWVAHEWLSEVAIAALVAVLGYAGALAIFVAAGLSAVVIAAALARWLGARPAGVTLLSAVALAVMAPSLTVRPQLLSWPLFAITLAALTADGDRPHRRIWLLPPMFALWANLHLGFVFGLLLVGLWWAGTAWDHTHGRDGADVRRASAVALACAAA